MEKRDNQERPFSTGDRKWLLSILLIMVIPILIISSSVRFPAAMTTATDAAADYVKSKLYPRKLSPNYKLFEKYAVIFDAGSTGSRVHVFRFDSNLDLVPVGDDLELFIKTEPGLSAYAKDPEAAANSLSQLLQKAEAIVPWWLRRSTPLKLGATAGLRQLEGDASDRILQAVRNLFEKKSSLKSKPEWVTILDGNQEGAYLWVALNYLKGNLGKEYSDTVGVVDLGGGSVQMVYAISESDAAKAPKPEDGGESYVQELYLKGKKYYLYAHSYLHYGLFAARAEILKLTQESDNPCLLAGFNGSYEYTNKVYRATSLPSGANFDTCREMAIQALGINDACTYNKCSFGGIWNGGEGNGSTDLFVASLFYDKAAQSGFIDSSLPHTIVHPAIFEETAKRACSISLKEAKSVYPKVRDVPYLCMDLVYQHTLLVNGFGLDPLQWITLVKEVEYKSFSVQAAWPLGSAIEAASQTLNPRDWILGFQNHKALI